MSTPKLSWTKLVPKPDPVHGIPCSRSSHGISLLQRTDGSKELFLYGGEHIARTPITKTNSGWLLTNDLTQWKWIDCSVESNNGPPERVAHAQAVYDNRYVYIFGGRTGINMEETAMQDMWVYDNETGTWEEVIADTTNGDPLPESRSFHRMISIGSYLYLFGGCGSSGRLNDLHQFNVATKTWKNLGKSQLRGRGGPNVIPVNSGKSIAVIAGFAGEETNDGHVYNIEEAKWDDNVLGTELNGLRPRSVCVSAGFPSVGVAIIFGGEVDPSDRGHEGAGGFEHDIVVLNETNASIIDTVKGDSNSETWPAKRGWGSATSIDNGNGTGEFYIFGGLTGDDTNPQRLDDLWKLELQK